MTALLTDILCNSSSPPHFQEVRQSSGTKLAAVVSFCEYSREMVGVGEVGDDMKSFDCVSGNRGKNIV